VFGDTLCRMLSAFFAIPMYVSTLMILFIAVDRYRRVVCRQSLSDCAARTLIVGSVMASTTLGFPMVGVSSLHELDDSDLAIHRRYCLEEWPDEALRRGYALLTFAGQFGVPLAVSVSLYCLIYRRLRRRRPPHGHITSKRRSVISISTLRKLRIFIPLTPTVAIWAVLGTAIKHPVPHRIKPSFVIFKIRAL